MLPGRALVICLILAPAAAHAADGSAPLEDEPVAAPAAIHGAASTSDTGSQREGASTAARRRTLLDRPFSYAGSTELPASLEPVATYSAGYATTEAAARPLAATQGRGGLVNELRLELGIVDHLAGYGLGRLAPPLAGESGARGAFEAGARVLVGDPAARGLRVTLDLGGGRDFREVGTAIARANVTYDLGTLRLGGLLHGEKPFAEGRDEVDFYLAVGASLRVADELRVGAEYVAQELEDAWEAEEAEGGARHFAGLTGAWNSGRLYLSGGPAFGLGGGAPALLGRLNVGTVF